MKPIKTKNTINEYHLNKHQPEKPQFTIYNLNEYIKKHQQHTTLPHIHSYYQILWFTKGTGKHFVDFNGYKVAENSLFFIAKGQVHCFDKNARYEGTIIHFNENFLIDNEHDIDLFLKYNIFNDPESEPVFTIQKNEIENCSNLVAQIKNEIATPTNFAHNEFLKLLLKLFLISIQRIGKRNKCKNLSIKNQSHLSFIKFRQLLEVNFRRVHSVNEYAGLLHISSKTLSNLTKEIAYKTPLEIINDRIILEAKRLLLNSANTINEIGFQLGYEDPSYFVKFFKRQTKKSPGDFRKSVS